MKLAIFSQLIKKQIGEVIAKKKEEEAKSIEIILNINNSNYRITTTIYIQEYFHLFSSK